MAQQTNTLSQTLNTAVTGCHPSSHHGLQSSRQQTTRTTTKHTSGSTCQSLDCNTFRLTLSESNPLKRSTSWITYCLLQLHCSSSPNRHEAPAALSTSARHVRPEELVHVVDVICTRCPMAPARNSNSSSFACQVPQAVHTASSR